MMDNRTTNNVGQFYWWFGVVEDRDDPLRMGRCRVRIMGYHIDSKEILPTEDLPWAVPIMPANNPSISGVGGSANGVVTGTWVVGFFADAKDKQQPIIIGSLPGIPDNEPDYTKGFNDPEGEYPSESIIHSGHGLNESDVSRLARGNDAETHKALINRRDTQFKDIPTATKPHVSTVSTTSKKETAGSFDEPIPRGYEPGDTGEVSNIFVQPKAQKKAVGNLTGIYPFNHVYESESGHIKEVDDTPDGERLFTQHNSGTYEEIIADGTKTVKVVGDNYELIAGGSNIYVRGNINLTCSGDKRERIDGDYILEKTKLAKFSQLESLNAWGEVTEEDKSGKKLNNPTRGDVKKYKVYVKNDKGNVVKVEFGDPNMSIKRDDPEARKNFRARHNCDQKKDKTTAGYWSCKFWSTKSVTDLMKG